MTVRQFPIMHDDALHSIPWDVIEPHEAQAYANHRQTLKQLAARGGLTPCEVLAIVEGRKWNRMPFGEARQKLIDYVRGATANTAQAGALQEAIDGAAVTNIQDALRMVRNMRDGTSPPTRWNFNKLEVLLERVETGLRA